MARALLVCLLASTLRVGCVVKDVEVQHPFYLRARVHDAQSASVLFQIPLENDQRACRMYRFTVRHNREPDYDMPQQNLTYWRNSLELKRLDAGDYRICAVICSEHKLPSTHDQPKNQSLPITACVTIHAYRSHLLVLTLYILVFIILAFSQIVFTARKREFQARIKSALVEVENALQKWRSVQTPSASVDRTQSYSILQTLVTLPAAPVERHRTLSLQVTTDEHLAAPPVLFHVGTPNLEIP